MKQQSEMNEAKVNANKRILLLVIYWFIGILLIMFFFLIFLFLKGADRGIINSFIYFIIEIIIMSICAIGVLKYRDKLKKSKRIEITTNNRKHGYISKIGLLSIYCLMLVGIWLFIWWLPPRMSTIIIGVIGSIGMIIVIGIVFHHWDEPI